MGRKASVATGGLLGLLPAPDITKLDEMTKRRGLGAEHAVAVDIASTPDPAMDRIIRAAGRDPDASGLARADKAALRREIEEALSPLLAYLEEKAVSRSQMRKRFEQIRSHAHSLR